MCVVNRESVVESRGIGTWNAMHLNTRIMHRPYLPSECLLEGLSEPTSWFQRWILRAPIRSPTGQSGDGGCNTAAIHRCLFASSLGLLGCILGLSLSLLWSRNAKVIRQNDWLMQDPP